MLPFQGKIVGGDFNPTRWVGLAYTVLSGRKKMLLNRYEKFYIFNFHTGKYTHRT
jgi:hypothetical protein